MVSKVDYEVLIKRPVKEVWNYWFEMENVPIWAHNIKDVRQITEGPRDVGTRFLWSMTFLGQDFTQTMEITEQVPFKSGTLKSLDGPGEVTYHYNFEPTPEGTKLTAHAEIEPKEGFFKLAAPIIVAVFRTQWKAGLENLKDIVEAAVPVPA